MHSYVIDAQLATPQRRATFLSGGTAPLVASTLLSFTRHWWVIALYYTGMTTIGFLTTCVTPETRGRNLDALEDAV